MGKLLIVPEIHVLTFCHAVHGQIEDLNRTETFCRIVLTLLYAPPLSVSNLSLFRCYSTSET